MADSSTEPRREVQEINERLMSALLRCAAATGAAFLALQDYRIAAAQSRDCMLTDAEMVAMLDVYTEFGR